jgi:hypothetical protein
MLAAISVLHWTGGLEDAFPKERLAVLKRIRSLYAHYSTGTQASQSAHQASNFCVYLAYMCIVTLVVHVFG